MFETICLICVKEINNFVFLENETYRTESPLKAMEFNPLHGLEIRFKSACFPLSEIK